MGRAAAFNSQWPTNTNCREPKQLRDAFTHAGALQFRTGNPKPLPFNPIPKTLYQSEGKDNHASPKHDNEHIIITTISALE